MQKTSTGKLFSASDLVSFSACARLTHLDKAKLETPAKEADFEQTVLIQNKGVAHEAGYLERLRWQYGAIVNFQSAVQSAKARFIDMFTVLG